MLVSAQVRGDREGPQLLVWSGTPDLWLSGRHGRCGAQQGGRLLRWYNKCEYDVINKHLQGSFQKLNWAADAAGEAGYDVLDLSKVLGAVYIQRHPLHED